MPARRKRSRFASDVEKRLNKLTRHLCQNDNTQTVWQQLLTDKQRNRIESRPSWQRNIITMWSKERRVSQPLAVIEMARKLGWLGDAAFYWLLKGIGEGKKPSANPRNKMKPEYQDGLIYYDGDVVRRVKQFAKKSKPQIILDAFQAKRWPRKIKNPWFGEVEQDKVYQAVTRLNKGLQAIIFEVIDGGEHVRWTERG